ncbi:MAG: hypothetical protein RDU30_12385 [Desulfovibrionaceae bacterium]|nr:hypothetical protein [Desulfovibrionaceae bacterium]
MPGKSMMPNKDRHVFVLVFVLYFIGAHSMCCNNAFAQTEAEGDVLLLMIPAVVAAASPSARAAIGSAGGVLAVGEVSVTVPAGGFASATQVALSGRQVDPDYLGNRQSLVWTLRVEAQGWNRPLTLCLGFVGGLDREIPVALADNLIVGSDRSDVRPTLVMGRVVSGMLYVDIGPNDSESLPAANRRQDAPLDVATRREATFWRITGFETLRSDHFRLYYPASIAAHPEDIPQQILNFAESAYAKLADMGFATTGLRNPVNITVERGMGEIDGEVGVPLSGKGGQYMNINVEICTPEHLERLKATIGHEYFHIIQNLYNPRSALALRHPLATPHFLLLSEASSVWFEGVMLGSSTYVSQVFLNTLPDYQYGLATGGGHTGIQNLGYWASGFLRYLRDARGSDVFVYDLWRNIQAQGTGTSGLSDLGALIETEGGMTTTSSKWINFLEKAASKTTAYSAWPALPSSITKYLKTPTDGYQPYGIFSDSIEPFSGRIWRVMFNHLESGDTKWAAVAKEADNISYALYKISSGAGYTRLGVITPGEPLHFSVGQGDAVIAVASNGDTSYPYRTAHLATVQIRLDGEPQYCLDVPPRWPMQYVGSIRTWKHPTLGFIVAEERYDNDDSSKPISAYCYDVATGERELVITWHENFKKASHIEYKGDVYHGSFKWWWENGNPWVERHYTDGELTGAYKSYLLDGTLEISGMYCDDKTGRIGEWYFYNNGSPYTCVHETCGDTPVCHY